jgi:hypothetical protein
MFVFSPLAQLRVLQAAGENPDIHCHHRCDAQYNQVFHVLLISSRALEIGNSGCRLSNALDAAWTRMTPAVAVAAGDSFGLADSDLGRQRVSH